MTDRVTAHAEAVVRNPQKEGAGRLHLLACKRHPKDLARAGTSAFPYIWDPDAAGAAKPFILDGAWWRCYFPFPLADVLRGSLFDVPLSSFGVFSSMLFGA